jgi:hypothetical protein
MEASTKELIAELKQVDAKLRKVRQSYDEKTKILNKMSAGIQARLRLRCDHEWIRDSYPYAEYYCKHCTLSK